VLKGRVWITKTNSNSKENSVNYWKYTVSQKTLPFVFLWYLRQILFDSANFWQKHTPGNLKQTHVHGAIYISFYMFVLYLVKTSDASECTLRRRPLPVRLVIEPESRNFFKRLFKLSTFWPLWKKFTN